MLYAEKLPPGPPPVASGPWKLDRGGQQRVAAELQIEFCDACDHLNSKVLWRGSQHWTMHKIRKPRPRFRSIHS